MSSYIWEDNFRKSYIQNGSTHICALVQIELKSRLFMVKEDKIMLEFYTPNISRMVLFSKTLDKLVQLENELNKSKTSRYLTYTELPRLIGSLEAKYKFAKRVMETMIVLETLK